MSAVLLLSTFGLGLRHGADWDHLAAITDITGAELERRRAALLALLYALGHGAAVMVLGVLAITAGERLPDWIDPVMERVVGVTLLVLAIVLVSGLRRDNAPVSRGMLLFQVMTSARERLRRTRRVVVEHQHGHAHDASHAHDHPPSDPTESALLTTHRHRHLHAVDVSRYSVGAALTVGLLHGVGAETGTQAVVIVGAAGAASTPVAVAVLGAFVAGIVATTAILSVGAAFGWKALSRDSRALRVLTLVTAVMSAAVGSLYVTGNAGALPAILG